MIMITNQALVTQRESLFDFLAYFSGALHAQSSFLLHISRPVKECIVVWTVEIVCLIVLSLTFVRFYRKLKHDI